MYPRKKPQKGDHIKVQRGTYTHHGIYIGSGKVIHFGGPNKGINNATISQTSLKDFADNGKVYLVQHSDSPEETISKAIECLGQQKYNLFKNNCEHFANYCITGKKESRQVKNAFKFDIGDDWFIPIVMGNTFSSLLFICGERLASIPLNHLSYNAIHKHIDSVIGELDIDDIDE